MGRASCSTHCLLPAWTRARRALGALDARSARVGQTSHHPFTRHSVEQALALAEAALCAAEDARVAAAAFARDAADATAAAAAPLLPSAEAAALSSAGPAGEPRCARPALRTAPPGHACCSARPAHLQSACANYAERRHSVACMRGGTGPKASWALVLLMKAKQIDGSQTVVDARKLKRKARA